MPVTVTGGGTPSWIQPRLERLTGKRVWTAKERREAMGIDWMTRTELSQAIPPAYGEFIGQIMLAHLKKSLAMTEGNV